MSSDSDDSEPGKIDTETLEELQAWRAELEEEIVFLTKTLKEVDNRVNDLTLEQLILKWIMNKENGEIESDNKSSSSKHGESEEKLDLAVPVVVKQCYDEEEEEED